MIYNEIAQWILIILLYVWCNTNFNRISRAFHGFKGWLNNVEEKLKGLR